jgi:hypothetical protein
MLRLFSPCDASIWLISISLYGGLKTWILFSLSLSLSLSFSLSQLSWTSQQGAAIINLNLIFGLFFGG